jgi:hypothetical protein
MDGSRAQTDINMELSRATKDAGIGQHKSHPSICFASLTVS